MDPITLLFSTCSVGFRICVRKAYAAAARDYQAAVREYRYILQLAIGAQQLCRRACDQLAARRQEAIGIHICPLDTFLVSSGVNGGLFGKPRRVFGERSSEEVRNLVVISGSLCTGIETGAVDTAKVVAGAAILVQGIQVLEARHWVNLPLLQTHVSEAAISLGGDSGASFVDALGLGGLEVGDAISGGLSILSVAASMAIWVKADLLEVRATTIGVGARRLDEKRAQLEAAADRAMLLAEELEAASYDLFARTIVAREYARIREARCGRTRDRSDLPRWILESLLRRATQLWLSLETPVFNS